MEKKKKQLPSVLTMIKTFSEELTSYVAKGMPNVTPEEYEDRLNTCFNCDFYLKKLNRCGKCGCLVEHKAKWKTTDCPEGKWKSQEAE